MNIKDIFWETLDMVKAPLIAAVFISIMMGFIKLMRFIDRKFDENKWITAALREPEEYEKAKQERIQAEKSFTASLPWNAIKIKYWMKCPTCGNMIAWPFVGRCNQCNTLITDLDHD
jgi:hypothetical protein